MTNTAKKTLVETYQALLNQNAANVATLENVSKAMGEALQKLTQYNLELAKFGKALTPTEDKKTPQNRSGSPR